MFIYPLIMVRILKFKVVQTQETLVFCTFTSGKSVMQIPFCTNVARMKRPFVQFETGQPLEFKVGLRSRICVCLVLTTLQRGNHLTTVKLESLVKRPGMVISRDILPSKLSPKTRFFHVDVAEAIKV